MVDLGSGREEDAMTNAAPVIDCDEHILEPPDLWETYLEPAYRQRALRIRVGDDGFEYLEIDGRPSTIARQGQSVGEQAYCGQMRCAAHSAFQITDPTQAHPSTRGQFFL